MRWTPRKRDLLVCLGALLSGCAPYWYQDTALTGFASLPEKTATKADLIALCGSEQGCTRWDTQARTVQSYLIAGASDCVVQHEAKHRAGWMHDTRAVVRLDCGEIER